MKTMTIRNIPDEVAAWLVATARERSTSVNATTVAVLTAAAIPDASSRKRDMSGLFGTWSRAQANRFDRVTEEAFGKVKDVDWE